MGPSRQTDRLVIALTSAFGGRYLGSDGSFLTQPRSKRCTMPTDVRDVLDLAFKKFDSFVTLWTLYVTVAFGLIGYIAAAPGHARSWWVRGPILGIFAVFTIGSFFGITAVR